MGKDYDFEILYSPGKAIVVADALNHKATSAPIWDMCLYLIVFIPLLDLTEVAQTKALKEENKKKWKDYQLLFLFWLW